MLAAEHPGVHIASLMPCNGSVRDSERVAKLLG